MAGRLLLIACCFCACAPAAHAATGPSLAVDAAADNRPISPLIYGMNFADPVLAAPIGLPIDRHGGNSDETYNYLVGAHNTGNDYFFENIADCWDDAHSYCAGGTAARAYREFIAQSRSLGVEPLVQLPMMGWVAKDAPTAHPLTCSFPKTTYMSQESFDPYDVNCGNGRMPDGDPDPNSGPPIVGNDPTVAGLQIDPPTWNTNWIADLVSRYGTAATGGVKFYELGNEPGLWYDTHRALHPARTTYDEIWNDTRDLGAAVKAADPGAKVLGFSEWGWLNYFCSALDDISNGCQASDVDRANHGGTPLVEWLLQQLRDYQQANGTRLVDYIDVHYYAQGGNTPDITRSLWDPTYTDPSYIGDVIRLIPRMHEWVDSNYPGTKLAISEYDLANAPDERTNTVIQADVLGIFAREGVDLATRFYAPSAGDLQADAWRIFRNYDGSGSRFGDTYVRSTSADQGRLAVYAARRGADNALTVLVLNKSDEELTSTMGISGHPISGTAAAFRWTGSGISRLADQPVAGGGMSATFPAKSMTLFVLSQPPAAPPAGPPPPVAPAPPPPASSRCVVPKVKGRTLRSAKSRIKRAGCRTGRVTRKFSRRVRRGRVISQRPRPGTRRAPGARVSLVLSRGRSR
jgi:hypothetical protein